MTAGSSYCPANLNSVWCFRYLIDAVLPLERLGHERECLCDPIVRLGAAQPEKSLSRVAKTFASEARDASGFVCAF